MKLFRDLISIQIVAAIAGLSCILSPLPADAEPNVLLVVVDTLRADRLEGTRDGDPLMPGLNAFAADSMRFLSASTPCTWTKPAMASIFTSLHFDVHKVFFSVDPSDPESTTANALPSNLLTMAGYLRGHGYETGGLQTNPNLDGAFGFARGFDRYDFHDNLPAEGLTDKAISMMDSWSGPFFQYVHYIDPHSPYRPPDAFAYPFELPEALKEKERALVQEQFMDYFWDAAYEFLGMKAGRDYPTLSPVGREGVRVLYDNETRYVDGAVKRLLSHVLKHHENTLIVFAADHGEEFWERGSMGHGTTMYEEQLKVPFLIRGPGIAASRIESHVSTLDILPTVAAYLGLEPNAFWQGRNLLDESQRGARPNFSKTRASWPRVKLHREAVVFDGYKFMLDGVSKERFLYDLKRDPIEAVNLLKDRPGLAKKMAALLEEQNAENARLSEILESVESSERLSPEQLEQLEAIGYVGK